MNYKSTSLVVLALLASGACSKIKKMEGMTKTTESMRVTTEEMSRTTHKLEEDSSETYPLVKASASQEARQRQIEKILDPETGSKRRFTEASTYYRAFEYQVAGSRVYMENPEKVEDFLTDAANEYSRLMGDLYEEINLHKMSPLKTGKNQTADAAFYALAATMHEVHNHHKRMTEKNNVATMSFYHMITTSLQDEDSRELKRYQRVLISGNSRKVMIELLKARVDMIAAVALSHMVDQEQMSLKSKGSALMFKISGGKTGKLNVPTIINDSNPGTKLTVAETLHKALETKEFLRSIGIENELHKDLKEIYSNIDIKENDNKEDNQDLSGIKQQIDELLN